jgi:predicted nucleic acid-binding protein
MENTYIVDACTLLTLLNKGEGGHKEVFEFFVKNQEATWLIPIHGYIEVKRNELRRIQNGEEYIKIGHYKIHTKPYPLTESFLVETFNSIEKYVSLKGADLIYALIAEKENIPIVTCDKGFKDYEDKIKVIYFKK